MFVPSFRTKKSGVPVLSKKEIDAIACQYVRDFQPEALTTPQEFKSEEFIECYLGATPDFQYLSHNGIYLGMTVFNTTDKVVVYCPETNTAEYIHADARTVIIDRRLIEDERQEHRYRYTLGHEGGHLALHSHLFSIDPSQLSRLDQPQQPIIQCRMDNPSARRRSTHHWTDRDWMEWQANVFSSCIHMNREAVGLLYTDCKSCEEVRRNMEAVKRMVSIFNVSPEAAAYRLKDLGYIQQSDRTDYAAIVPFLSLEQIYLCVD